MRRYSRLEQHVKQVQNTRAILAKSPVRAIESELEHQIHALSRLKSNTGRTLSASTDRIYPKLLKRITQKDRDHIAQLYADGLSFVEVAEQTGVARSTAMRIVRSRGVEVRPRGRTYQRSAAPPDAPPSQ